MVQNYRKKPLVVGLTFYNLQTIRPQVEAEQVKDLLSSRTEWIELTKT